MVINDKPYHCFSPEASRTRNDVFYLTPEPSCNADSPVWYSTQPLGALAVSKMLARARVVREIQDALYPQTSDTLSWISSYLDVGINWGIWHQLVYNPFHDDSRTNCWLAPCHGTHWMIGSVLFIALPYYICFVIGHAYQQTDCKYRCMNCTRDCRECKQLYSFVHWLLLAASFRPLIVYNIHYLI